MGNLAGIAKKEDFGAPMILLDAASVTTESGVENDIRGNPGKRQVTVISKDCWKEACEELKAELPWTTRRANLMVEGILFEDLLDKQIHIGELELLVTGPCAPCSRMEGMHAGLQKALTPKLRGGITCTVLKSANINIGDSVTVIDG